MSKHTQTEWTFEKRTGGNGHYEYIVHLDDKSRTFQSWGWGSLHRIILYGSGLGQNQLNPVTPEQHEEALANALLIKAAPKLLAACQRFLECPPRDRHDMYLEEIIRDAMSGMEGGSQ